MSFKVKASGVVGLIAVVAALGSATAMASSMPPPQGVKADGLRLNAIARSYEQSRPAASFYTPKALTAMSLRGERNTQSQFIPGYTDFPNALRVADEQASKTSSQASSQTGFIPGYTDFPNALRVADEQRSTFIPGYTDFPNALRLAQPGTVRLPTVVVKTTSADSGFNWDDAGIGALSVLASAIIGAGLILSARRGRNAKLAL
jgi:hypothetical protein